VSNHLPSGSLGEAAVLVDYDNVMTYRERTLLDLSENLHFLIPPLSALVGTVLGPSSLNMRFYGGWLTSRSRPSRRAQWLFSQLPFFRGRIDGMLVRPTLAYSLACRPNDYLVGTLRSRENGSYIQKMVDTLLCMDTWFFSVSCALPTFLVSDDDDFVPALLAPYSINQSVRLYCVRKRLDGVGLNDPILRSAGVHLLSLPGGTTCPSTTSQDTGVTV
jgi:hypothetical protein